MGHGNGRSTPKNLRQAEGDRQAPWFPFGCQYYPPWHRLKPVGHPEQHAFDIVSVFNDGHPCWSGN